MTMSVRTFKFKLLTSHARARCWSVGSLPYLACHLAVCASAIMLHSGLMLGCQWSKALETAPGLIFEGRSMERPRHPQLAVTVGCTFRIISRYRRPGARAFSESESASGPVSRTMSPAGLQVRSGQVYY